MYQVTCYYSKNSSSRTFQAIEEYYITDGMLYLRNTDDYAWYLPLKFISEIQINPYKEDKAERNCKSCDNYKDGYCSVLDMKPRYPEQSCDYFSGQKVRNEYGRVSN